MFYVEHVNFTNQFQESTASLGRVSLFCGLMGNLVIQVINSPLNYGSS